MADTVVLVHGLGRSHLSFFRLRNKLLHAGYQVANIAYPSRAKPIEELAELVKSKLPANEGRMHFVTHSLGGILLRVILAEEKLSNMGRAVMLCPPNQGSSLATRLKNWYLYKLFTGPAGQQITTAEDSVPRRLGPANFEVGIIIGNRSIDPLAFFVDGDSDGKVALEEAKLQGMEDFLVVPNGHTFLMSDSKVMGQIIHFLQYGKFDRADLPT